MKEPFNFKRHFLIICTLMFLSFTSFSQITIEGTIIDEEDTLPMIGVSIKEENTKNGTVTDINGKYSIKISGPKSKLVFSYIGKETIIRQVGEQKIINVTLKNAENLLDEVVAIGYGTMKKSDLTGSVSSLSSHVLEESRSTSFTSSLAGRLSGVSVIQSGGDPGAGISIQIRGANSVSGGTSPLYVIDGVLMENSQSEIQGGGRQGGGSLDPMAAINPNDIQSIEVLKDASATAIYGSRGANGVVLITTKTGTKDGSTHINFSTSFGSEFLPQKRINALNGPEYEEYMRIRNPFPADFDFENGTLSDDLKKYWNEDGTPKTTGERTVWQDKIFQTGMSQNYNLSLRGSSKNTSYVMSLGYYDKEGIIKTSNMDRMTFSAKIDNSVNKYFKLGINLNGSLVHNRGVVSASDQTSNNFFSQIITFQPNINESMISDNVDDTEDPSSNVNNPVNTLNNVIQRSEARRIQGNTYITFTPTKNWILKSTLGGYLADAKSKNFYPSTTGLGRLDNGRANQAVNMTSNIINENTITYKNNIKKIHDFSILGGMTFQRVTSDYVSITATNIEMEDLKEESIKYGANVLAPENSYSYYSLMSALGRINYSLMNKYLLTASIRADGSSKYPKGNKFSYFPSAAIAWKMNEEAFIKQISEIEQLKLRVGYGRTGNQSIPTLSALAMMEKIYYSYNTSQGNTGAATIVTGVKPSTIGNNRLRWETTSQYNAGIDLYAFNGILNFTGDIYYKYTTDLLITEQLPGISGYQSVIRNIGAVENKGIEVAITTRNIKTRKFSWMTDLNFTINRNNVKNIGGGDNDRIPITPSAIVQGHYRDVFYVREGYPIGAMFGYKADGLYQCKDFKEFYTDPNDKNTFISDAQKQKEIYNNTKNGTSGFTLMDGVTPRFSEVVEPGYVKLKGDGVNVDERVYLGSAEAKFYGGFNNRFSYKNFDLSIFIQYSYGNKLFNSNHGVLEGRNKYNIEKDYYDNMWLIDNQSGSKHHWQDGLGRERATSIQVEDASYIKIKDVTLSYSLPKSKLRKIGIKGIRLSVTGNNLFTFTKYSWYDPEFSARNPLTAGLDKFSYPMGRSLVGSINIDL